MRLCFVRRYADCSKQFCSKCNFYKAGTPIGFPSSSYIGENYTQLVVISTAAPLEFPFTFKIVDTIIVYPIIGPTHNYTFPTTPATTAPPSLVGAHALEASTLGRASGLPPIVMPPGVGPGGTQEIIAREIAKSLILIPASVGQRTLPGLRNWSFSPSYKVINLQDGKTYTLYQGDTFTIKFKDGTTLKIMVDVSTALMDVTAYKIAANTHSAQPGSSLTSGNGTSFPSLSYSGGPSEIVWADSFSLPKGEIIIEEIPGSSTIEGSGGTVVIFGGDS